MAKRRDQRGWNCYRRDIPEPQAKKIVDRLIKNGKVWGKTVTITNDKTKFSVWTK